ncbi:MAG: long-chain fatty acid--CoA ligase [Bacteroidales bacterium]|nr:long-chain fatty acid--CoA ligase [Bacteroidales bacterium]
MELTRIFDILDSIKIKFPHKSNALVDKINGEWVNCSIEEYFNHVQYLSYGLLSLGMKKGDMVVTISNNRQEWNFMDMAICQTGLVHVPIYPTISDSDYEYILKHCEPKLLIVSDKALFERLRLITGGVGLKKGIYTFNEVSDAKNWKEIYKLGKEYSEQGKESLINIKNSIKPDDLATLIYTSGTTGKPKGVMLSHRNILSNIKGISQVFHFNENDRILSFLPVSHVFERTINYYFQKQGVGIYYAENMGTISDNLKEVKPTVFIAVPRVLERIYDKIISVGKELKGFKKIIFFWAVNLGLKYEFHNRNGRLYDFNLSVANKLVFTKWRKAVGASLKLIVAGGAALQPRLIRIFNAAGIPLVEGYGMSETSPVIAVNDFDAGKVVIGTVGPVLPGVKVKISEDGEILVSGSSIMMGYYKDAEQTKQVIDEDGWLHTGDIGEWVEGEYLKITDRKKEIFKLSSGKYVSPQVIENKFKESILIEQVMVIGENEKFASALIVPNFTYLQKWGSHHGIKIRENKEIIAHHRVISAYQKEINDLNKHLGKTEHIKRFRLVPDEWTVQSGELSPTLKLKRRYVFKKYEKIINEIYSVQKQE